MTDKNMPDEIKIIRGQRVYSYSERLKRLSVLNNKTGCIEWKGSLRKGYGRLMIGSRTDNSRRSVSAHRLSYEVNVGKIPENTMVCHKCDNPKCINPDHLFVGTHQDNVDDRERKGRNKTGNVFGETHPKAKLTWESVEKIRSMRGKKTQQEIAMNFNVSRGCIKDVLLNKTWNRKPEPPEVSDEK